MMTAQVADANRAKELGEMSAAVPRDTTIEYYAESALVDLRPELASVTAPLLAISATPPALSVEKASVVRNRWAKLFANAPNLTFMHFERTHHFVMDDRPEKLDEVIAGFLKDERDDRDD